MTKLLNKILILLIVTIIFIGGYLYFSDSLKSEAAVSSDSALSSSTGIDISSILGSNSSASDKIASDTAFISKLASLTKIKIDTSIFSNKLFTSLNDNNIEIELSSVGRSNPFSAIGSDVSGGQVAISPVITNQASQVTDKTAVLNGTVNDSTNTSVYFEYGLTEAFGKTTAPLKQSLIGNFNINLTGLSSKTTYFFRAVSKIKNTLVYGDIITFTTN